MKQLSILFCLLFAAGYAWGQSSLKGWEVSFTYGLEAHDKRLFNYAHRVDRERLRGMHPETFGTNAYFLAVQRRWISAGRLSIRSGLAAEYLEASFTRPFDHSAFGNDYFRILRLLNRYQKLLGGALTTVDYELVSNLSLQVLAKANFEFYTRADNTLSSRPEYPYEMRDFRFHSFELVPGLSYRLGPVSLAFGIRALNARRVDPIVFGPWLRHDIVDQRMDYYNPFRMNFTLGYQW
jgi:hypothetical protein